MISSIKFITYKMKEEKIIWVNASNMNLSVYLFADKYRV